jgi:archaetidylinositol phosphate synthase
METSKMQELELNIAVQQVGNFREAKRIQQTFITIAEKKALRWLAERMPAVINSDHLTVLGALGMFLAGTSYALTRFNRYGLLVACFFLAVNWFGDSLDGTLARYRNRQRPRYGFYVDHVIDCFGVSVLLAGMGISGYMNPLIAAWMLVAYLLLSSEIFLASYALARFEMSYFYFGPTELRILLCAGNLYVFFHPGVHPFGLPLSLWDFGALLGSIGMVGIAIVSFIRHTRILYEEERLR